MTHSPAFAALCSDPAYLENRWKRLALLGMQPALDQLELYSTRVGPL